MTVQAAKEFMIALVDDADATAEADRAYLAALETIASSKGFDANADDLRTALIEMRSAGQLDPDADTEDEVSGYNFTMQGGPPSGGKYIESITGIQATFEPLGFLRPTFKL